MKSNLLVAALAFAMICAARASADDALGADVKCPVSGKTAKQTVTAEFEGGTVYLCCHNCQKAFKKDPAKFAAQARHQLVQTGQEKEVHCPITHKPFKDNISLSVGGVEVKFCCNKCKGKVEKMDSKEQVLACFGTADCYEAVGK